MLVMEVYVRNYLSIVDELTDELASKRRPDEYKHATESYQPVVIFVHFSLFMQVVVAKKQ